METSLEILMQDNLPALILALIILNVVQSTFMWVMYHSIKDIKSSITWGDTCNERHKRIDKRLDNLEKGE